MGAPAGEHKCLTTAKGPASIYKFTLGLRYLTQAGKEKTKTTGEELRATE